MFARKNRLTKQKDIDAVFKEGRSSYDSLLGVKCRENQLEHSRFTVIVASRNIKQAAARNRIKRQIRALVKANLEATAKGCDVAIIVRPQAWHSPNRTLRQSLHKHLQKLGLTPRQSDHGD